MWKSGNGMATRAPSELPNKPSFYTLPSQNEPRIGEKSIESWLAQKLFCPTLHSQAFVWFRFCKTTFTSFLWTFQQIESIYILNISTDLICSLIAHFTSCKRANFKVKWDCLRLWCFLCPMQHYVQYVHFVLYVQYVHYVHWCSSMCLQK